MQRGYGGLTVRGKFTTAHRISWALFNGRYPKKQMDICHTCDNRKCINPKHLFIGTRSDNMMDCSRKGRLKNQNAIKTHCKRGHRFVEGSFYRYADGRKECRACKKINNKRHRAKVRMKKLKHNQGEGE